MFKGNEQFTTLCKRKDWTTVFCITCFLFLSKNWIHLLQNEGLRAHNYPSTLILGQLDSLKKSQIKDNHLKKYISKMSKPSLDFLKSICQQLFLVFSARIVSLLLSFTNYFCHSESGQVYTPSKMDLLSTPASKKMAFQFQFRRRQRFVVVPAQIFVVLAQCQYFNWLYTKGNGTSSVPYHYVLHVHVNIFMSTFKWGFRKLISPFLPFCVCWSPDKWEISEKIQL